MVSLVTRPHQIGDFYPTMCIATNASWPKGACGLIHCQKEAIADGDCRDSLLRSRPPAKSSIKDLALRTKQYHTSLDYSIVNTKHIFFEEDPGLGDTWSGGPIPYNSKPTSCRINKELSLKKRIKSTTPHSTSIGDYYHHYSRWRQEDSLIVATFKEAAKK